MEKQLFSAMLTERAFRRYTINMRDICQEPVFVNAPPEPVKCDKKTSNKPTTFQSAMYEPNILGTITEFTYVNGRVAVLIVGLENVDITFNTKMEVDICIINGEPVFHMLAAPTMSEAITEAMNEAPHISTFIAYGKIDRVRPTNHAYARMMFALFTESAGFRMDCKEEFAHMKLFTEYEGKCYRVTGASRLGDVFLHSNHEIDEGYVTRVSYVDLKRFEKSPF